MRIWDIAPGYLNRQSLLGEHRELHGLASVHLYAKRGYAHHPETRRWTGLLGALAVRHGLLVAEMALRGYRHHSPLPVVPDPSRWPPYLDAPPVQFDLLAAKYRGKPQGRIPLPTRSQHLWAQHKYAVLARDPGLYAEFGRRAVGRDTPERFSAFAMELTALLRQAPTFGGILNAIQHMWGHVRRYATPAQAAAAQESPEAMLALTQALAVHHDSYLWHSVALSEMAFWLAWHRDRAALIQVPQYADCPGAPTPISHSR